MSWQAALVRWAIRRKMRRGTGGEDLIFGTAGRAELSREAFVKNVRAFLDQTVTSMPKPMRGTRVEPVRSGAARGEWVSVPRSTDQKAPVILYCHGGGYFWGSPLGQRNMLARISNLTGARVFWLDYRLAPEHPYPAALQDARAAYDWLIDDQGIDPQNLMVAGESAGGGLAMLLLADLREGQRPLPAGAFLFSPWTDLTMSGASVDTYDAHDAVVNRAELEWCADLFLSGPDADPRPASPLFSDLSGLPPILIQAASTEVLLDDSRRLAEAVLSAGGRCDLAIWPDLHHVWQMHAFFLPEGRAALADVARFSKEVLSAAA